MNTKRPESGAETPTSLGPLQHGQGVVGPWASPTGPSQYLATWEQLPFPLGWLQVMLVVKNPPSNVKDTRDRVQSLGQEDPWRRAWQPTPEFLPGESPWMEEPYRLQSMGSQRIRHNLGDLAHMHTWYCRIHYSYKAFNLELVYRLLSLVFSFYTEKNLERLILFSAFSSCYL